jgi:heterodisulfide reductase subunit D
MGILKWIAGEKVLYYPGCLTKGVLKTEFENYKEIFNRLGMDFILLSDDEVCCGLPVLNAGYKKDVRKLARKNLKLFREKGVEKIITSCPSCYHTFSHVYPKILKDWDIPVQHATVAILERLKKKGISWKGKDEDREIVGYHDPCHLGRYSNIYEEPREVIHLLGGKILESRFNRQSAICCGGGGGVRANFPNLAKGVAKERVKSFDKSVKRIISPCGLCSANLNSVDDKSVEFSSFVLGRLRGLGR